MLDRLGVRMTVTKSDRLKDMGSMFREPTEEERTKEQELVNDLYEQFLEAVAGGRNMAPEKVRQLATGEIYTARKAKDLGLVDELGDLEHAIDVASGLAGVARNPVWMRPKRNIRELLSGVVGTSMVDAVVNRLEERLISRYDFQHRF
jgi:protease-4